MSNQGEEVFETAEEMAVRERREQRQQEIRDRLLARKYQDLFLGSDDGRDVLNDIMAQGRVYASLFTGNSKTYFYLGMRELAMYILGQCNMADLAAFDAEVRLAREQYLRDVRDGKELPPDDIY